MLTIRKIYWYHCHNLFIITEAEMAKNRVMELK